jgi:hypothetical protein
MGEGLAYSHPRNARIPKLRAGIYLERKAWVLLRQHLKKEGGEAQKHSSDSEVKRVECQ